MRLRGPRWLAVAIVSIVALLGVEAPAMAATGADGFPILHGASNDEAHSCRVIGTSDNDTYEAVVCVDIVTKNEGSNEYGVYGQTEAICQENIGGTWTIVQCEKIISSGSWNTEPGSLQENGLGGECGYTGYAACPSGRYYMSSDIWIWYTPNSSCGSDPNSDYDEWVFDYGNGTTITLPDDVPITGPSSNFSTGHYYTCW